MVAAPHGAAERRSGRAADDGVDLIGIGEMGIGNTTPASAILAAFTGLSADEVVGRGTGVDDEGLAYSAYASLGFPVTMPGTFRAYFQSKSSTCAFAAEIFFDLLEAMRTAPPTEEELRTSKASFIETFPRRFATAAQTVSLFATDELLGRDHAYWSAYRERVAAVDGEDVQEALKAALDPDTMLMLVVGNIEEILEGHPEHDAKLSDFGEIRKLPLRDPMTLEPIAE